MRRSKIRVPSDDPLTRERMLDLATGLAEAERRRLENATAKFLENFASDPLYALRWNVGDIPALVTVCSVWDLAIGFLDRDPTNTPEDLRKMLDALRRHAAEEVDRLVDGQAWNRHSTNPWSNLADIGEVNGKLEAWGDIRQFAEWALGEIKAPPAPGGTTP